MNFYVSGYNHRFAVMFESSPQIYALVKRELKASRGDSK